MAREEQLKSKIHECLKQLEWILVKIGMLCDDCRRELDDRARQSGRTSSFCDGRAVTCPLYMGGAHAMSALESLHELEKRRGTREEEKHE